MNIIKRIEIVNFRSIDRLVLENGLTDLNIIVGNNDAGKSNILRSLNLFFNGHTEIDQPLNFWQDFNKNIVRKTVRSKYIRIVVDIHLKYEKDKWIRWVKQWDHNGVKKIDEWQVFENRTGDPSDFSKNSRAVGWLERLRYRYVPAVKGPDYFKHLYEQLHDTLASVFGTQFHADSEKFINGIRGITQGITDQLNQELGIPNRLSVPSDFKALFATLDFSFDLGDQSFFLSQRGDGIKARHIPIILKYLADNENQALSGTTSVNTIWGFEEPENNLEMSQAFQLARSFVGYAHPMQIFVTTHSPAFYSLDDERRITKWFTRRNEENNTEVIQITSENEVNLDREMGMLAYVTPFVEAKNIEYEKEKAEKERLANALNEAMDHTRCLVFTEDEQSDSELMRNILSAHGFSMAETTVRCYHGKDNLKAAILAADLAAIRMPQLEVVLFHRDRDIDGDETEAWVVAEFQKRQRRKYKYFLTENYDLEAYLLVPDHIHSLYPALSIETIEQRIQEATDAKRNDSLKTLTNVHIQNATANTLKRGRPVTEINYSALNQEVQNLYNDNVTRYRYSKKVLSHALGLLQKDLGCNLDVVRASPHLQIPVLVEIKNQIWPASAAESASA